MQNCKLMVLSTLVNNNCVHNAKRNNSSGGVHSEDEEDQFQDAVEEIREEILLPSAQTHRRSCSDLSQVRLG